MFNKRLRGTNMTTTILRLPAVTARIGLARSTIYRHVSDGTFPRPVRLGARAVGWFETDIENWLAQRTSRGGSNTLRNNSGTATEGKA